METNIEEQNRPGKEDVPQNLEEQMALVLYEEGFLQQAIEKDPTQFLVEEAGIIKFDLAQVKLVLNNNGTNLEKLFREFLKHNRGEIDLTQIQQLPDEEKTKFQEEEKTKFQEELTVYERSDQTTVDILGIIEGEIRNVINLIIKKSEKLKQNRFKQTVNEARVLADNLEATANSIFLTPSKSIDDFNNNLNKYIYETKQILSIHREFWKVIVANILLIIPGIVSLFRLAVGKKCVFSETTSTRKINAIEKQINACGTIGIFKHNRSSDGNHNSEEDEPNTVSLNTKP